MTFKTFSIRNRNIRTHYRKAFATAKHFEFDEYAQHSKTTTVTLENLLNNLLIKDTKKMLSLQQIQKVDQLDRKQLLHQEKRNDKQCIPLSVAYSRALPYLKDILTKHCHILQANSSCKKTFNTLPIIAFRKGTSLKQIIGINNMHNNEKFIKTKNNHHTGKCVPCNSTRCLCCQQLSKATFKSNQTNKTFKIYHRVNCKIVKL